MITSTTPSQFEIPSEVRVVAERSIQRAKLALDSYIQATEQAAASFEGRTEASQIRAPVMSRRAMTFASQNAMSAFEFAQRIIQAKNVTDFIRLLNDFLQLQMRMLSEQDKDRGETFGKLAMDNDRIARTYDLAS